MHPREVRTRISPTAGTADTLYIWKKEKATGEKLLVAGTGNPQLRNGVAGFRNGLSSPHNRAELDLTRRGACRRSLGRARLLLRRLAGDLRGGDVRSLHVLRGAGLVHGVGAAVVSGRLDELRVVLAEALGGEEHAAHLREVDEEQPPRDAHHEDAEVEEALVGTAGLAAEEGRERNHRAEVATGANHAGHNAERGAGHVGHDAVVQALGGLHADREANHAEHSHAHEVLVLDAVAGVAAAREGRLEDHVEAVVEVPQLLERGGERRLVAAALDHLRAVDGHPPVARPHGQAARLEHVAVRVRVSGLEGVGRQGVELDPPHRVGAVKGRVGAEGDGGHAAAQGALESLHGPCRPQASAHARLPVGVVGEHATQATRDEVHQAVERGEQAGDLRREAVVLVEVEGGDRVHGELDPEAHAVGGRQDPRVDVGEARLEHDRALGLLLGARRLELGDVAVGEVARRQCEDAAEDVHGERHDVAQPPRHVLPLRRSARDGAVEAEEDEGHGKVGHAAAEVAPAGGRRVGQAHNRLGVHLPGKHGVQTGWRAGACRGERVLAHLSAPDLGAHEGGEGEADDHAADDPAGGILHEHNAEDGRGGDPQQKRDAAARAQHVANDTASGTRIKMSLARIGEEGGG
eukprot:scaffold20882_cov71-Phaeocystis_antarctica.AAC.4